MLQIGTGAIIGNILAGLMMDKNKSNSYTLIGWINILCEVVAFALLFLYIYNDTYTLWFASVMTFFWGFADSFRMTFLNCVMGF